MNFRRGQDIKPGDTVRYGNASGGFFREIAPVITDREKRENPGQVFYEPKGQDKNQETASHVKAAIVRRSGIPQDKIIVCGIGF